MSIRVGQLLRAPFRCCWCSGRFRVISVGECPFDGRRAFAFKCVRCGNGGSFPVSLLSGGRLMREFGRKL